MICQGPIGDNRVRTYSFRRARRATRPRSSSLGAQPGQGAWGGTTPAPPSRTWHHHTYIQHDKPYPNITKRIPDVRASQRRSLLVRERALGDRPYERRGRAHVLRKRAVVRERPAHHEARDLRADAQVWVRGCGGGPDLHYGPGEVAPGHRAGLRAPRVDDWGWDA